MPELVALIFGAVASYCCCLKGKQPPRTLIFLNTQTQRKRQAEKRPRRVCALDSVNLDKEGPGGKPQVQPEHPPRRVLVRFFFQEKCAEGQRKSPRSDQ